MSGELIPKFDDVMLPLLRAIDEGHDSVVASLPYLKRHFSLSDAQMEHLTPSGQMPTIVNRAGWARTYMKKAGLIAPTKWGRYRVTADGKAILAEGLAKIDKQVLERFPAFQAWQNSSRSSALKEEAVSEQAIADATPEEVMEAAFLQRDSALVEELLEAVLGVTPARFEQLIVELLLAMGYGDGRAEMGQAIGKSGDGGIDGVVNEDKLGLDAVYIQAKRYAPDNTVGRPALQAFIGSMTGESATKGVFVTTSSFSKEAQDYVRRVQQRVVLIDGKRLARLMIDHGVGVKADKTYVLRSVDANFFDVV